jgi:pimeloyl-ACP methyl ester carboxylesterase
MEQSLINPFSHLLPKQLMDMAKPFSQGPFSEIQAPGLLKLVLEARGPWEHASLLGAWPLLKLAPKGDGHPVMVLPGFVAGDASTFLLRQFLNDRGYKASGWMQGRNLGPKPGVLESALEHVKQLHRDSGAKVSIIGWSLGGIYARELAKLAPESVRCVISLGSPFAGPGEATNAWWLFKLFNPDHANVSENLRDLVAAPSCPTTAIFSRTDGVVPWQSSSHNAAQLAARSDIENIEVESSHLGMGAHPLVLYAIADRLAQAEGQWLPFDREGWRKLVFRNPMRPGLFF